MNESDTIIIKKANGSFASFATGFWLLPWLAITGTMLYGILFDNNGRTDDYLTILIPLLIVGLLVIRQFLWNLKGRDEIEFLPKTVKLTRKGSFFHRPVTELKYDKFYGFALGEFKGTPFWVVLWGLGGNRIVARCGSYKRLIGQGLTKTEAAKYVELLNEKIKTKKHNII